MAPDSMIRVWEVYGLDKLAGHPNQVDKSPFAYAWDNPIKLTDPDGNCLGGCRELFLALDKALQVTKSEGHWKLLSVLSRGLGKYWI
ncbi:MAG: hypothetical protein IPL46_06600 [Saprospiraceae bacterium]|nr:hypothetical protein [Saprospiraceae bacterium]